MNTFEELLGAILSGEPFALSRYGDGEWAAIFGEDGENCDGHQYFPEMGIELADTVQSYHDAPYYYGMVRIARTVYKERIVRYIRHYGIWAHWADGTIMADAAKAGRLFPLIDLLRYRKVLYVGPQYLNTVEFHKNLFWPKQFVTVPAKNSFLNKENIVEIIAKEYMVGDYDLIGFSAGPTTEIMMWELWTYLKQNVAMVDFGSLWDGLIGHPTRKYHYEPGWPELVKKNLGQ